MKRIIINLLFLFNICFISAENGYELWLRYHKINNTVLLNDYQKLNQEVVFPVNSDRLKVAKKELQLGFKGLLGINLNEVQKISQQGLVIGTPDSSPLICASSHVNEIKSLDDEGFIIRTTTIGGKTVNIIAAKTDIGVLYGVFHYLKLMQTNRPLNNLSVKEEPKLQLRVLNHWDNLDGTIERGYAGYTLWIGLVCLITKIVVIQIMHGLMPLSELMVLC